MKAVVTDMRLRLDVGGRLLGSTVNHIELEAEFSPEWDDCPIRIARFSKGEEAHAFTLTDNRIDKSLGVNLTPGRWELRMIGYAEQDGEMTERINTNGVQFTVEEGVADGGEEPLPEIETTIAEQILLTAANAKAIAESVEERADNGEFNGSDADVTTENIQRALGYTPADDQTAMEYFILTYDGTRFYHGSTPMSFNAIKTKCLDEKHFVYCQYNGDLYIPQHVLGAQIFFDATYIRSGNVEVHRISITPAGTATETVTTQEKLIAGSGITIAEDGKTISAAEAEVTADGIRNALGYTPADAEDVAENALDIEKLKAAAEGYQYMFQQDSTEAYEKSVPSDAMQWATLDKVGGKTLVWNQIFKITEGLPFTRNGVTITKKDDTTVVLNGTATENTQQVISSIPGATVKGHVYITKNLKSNGLGLFGYYGIDEIIRAVATSTNPYLSITIKSGETFDNREVSLFCFDLTAMFGAGNEPTAEEFRKIFPSDYYPYSSSTLVTYSPETVVSSTGDTKDLSAMVQKYFPNGMKSAGSVYDAFETDDDGKVWAVQKIGNVDLGICPTGLLGAQTDGYRYCSTVSGIGGNGYAILCTAFSTNKPHTASTITVGEMYSIRANNMLYTVIADDITALEFCERYSGVMLYYELANYIRTEVTEPFPSNLNVEAGGSLTITNDQGDAYHVSLPNSETWMIKLPGVNT